MLMMAAVQVSCTYNHAVAQVQEIVSTCLREHHVKEVCFLTVSFHILMLLNCLLVVAPVVGTV